MQTQKHGEAMRVEAPGKRRTKAQLRAEYRKYQQIAYQWANHDEWNEAVEHLAKKLAKGDKITPAIWVEAAKRATVECDRCRGTGEYVWGAIVNGRATKKGVCFACEGKGRQNQGDFIRNRTYWNHVKVV